MSWLAEHCPHLLEIPSVEDLLQDAELTNSTDQLESFMEAMVLREHSKRTEAPMPARLYSLMEEIFYWRADLLERIQKVVSNHPILRALQQELELKDQTHARTMLVPTAVDRAL